MDHRTARSRGSCTSAPIDSNASPNFRLSPFNRSLRRGDLSMGVNGSVVTPSLDGSGLESRWKLRPYGGAAHPETAELLATSS